MVRRIVFDINIGDDTVSYGIVTARTITDVSVHLAFDSNHFATFTPGVSLAIIEEPGRSPRSA